jgi:hypothetical protein
MLNSLLLSHSWIGQGFASHFMTSALVIDPFPAVNFGLLPCGMSSKVKSSAGGAPSIDLDLHLKHDACRTYIPSDIVQFC